jgi:acyl-CoA thioesterase-1
MLWMLAAPATLAAPVTVLVLGDSLAAGLGVERDEAFPALLETMAKTEGLPVVVVNAGVSGDTSAGGRGRINWLLNRKTDVLVLELGANDGLRGIPPETTTENLQAIIDAAKTKYPDIRIVIAGMKMPPNLGPDYGAKFEQIFPRLAADNEALLVPFLLENVGGVADLNQEDRIHPNARGHRLIADNVWKHLGPLLRSITAK